VDKSKSNTQVRSEPELHDQQVDRSTSASAQTKSARTKGKTKDQPKPKHQRKAELKSKDKSKDKDKRNAKPSTQAALIAVDFLELAQAPVMPTKLVRDSFTMPAEDFGLIAQLKERALEFRRPTKKSELLRAGLQVLAGLEKSDLHEALEQLRPLKPGRPKNRR
jgi:hypothetical protein